MLQTRASEISKSVEKIQEISEKMLSISPNDIRFLLYYAKFLKQIVNSEQEALALYEKAQNIYQRIMSNNKGKDLGGTGGGPTSGPSTYETCLYGDNSAGGILILGLSADKVGVIMAANDEIARILGYPRKYLVGSKVNSI